MDVRLLVLGNARRACLCKRRSLGDAVAAPDEKLPEMGHGDLVCVDLDRDGEPVRRDLSGEGDLTGDRRADRAICFESDVDTAVLSAGVRIVAERELAKDAALRRPRPCLGARGERERERDREHGGSEHSRCPRSEHGSTVAALQEEEQCDFTDLSQRGAVERIPWYAGEADDEIHRLTARDSGCDELRDGPDGGVIESAPLVLASQRRGPA